MLKIILRLLGSVFRSRRDLALENLALRHQLHVLQRPQRWIQLKNRDLLLWIALCRIWRDWRKSLTIVQPETVVRWHRQVVHFNVTDSPTARWTAHQLVQAFPWDTAPKFLLRDRDAICGLEFLRSVSNLGVEDVRTSPRSPSEKVGDASRGME